MDELNYQTQMEEEDNELWLKERLITSIKYIKYKGEVGEVVGYSNNKVLLIVNGRKVATDLEKVNLVTSIKE